MKPQGRGFRGLGLLLLACLLVTGCQTVYYQAWEKFGKEKRDLLKDNVKDARNEQEQAAEQFKDALTRLKEMYGFQGGNLEKAYDKLKADYDRSASRAKAVSSRVEKVEQIATDLFAEWEAEIKNMSNDRLSANSRAQLRQTREKYESLHASMKKAESSMQPVLKQFQDQVLYLKHNLNAQAIGSLKGEAVDIEKEIQRLIKDVNASIAEADAFIQGME
ncbi:MAG: DUF2959 domain-containing protein [Verrucomicrobiota bacterium]|nr:DUF2959 domain-containing protein [Verrucomicrobiota bacterium]